MKSARIVCALLFCVPAAAAAQVTTQPPPPPPPVSRVPLPGDSIRRAAGDTLRLRADSVLIQWAEPDSVMRSLMNKPGYTITRYQGATVSFDASKNTLVIVAPDSGVAGVQRGAQVVVADSSIVLNDSTKRVFVRGERIVLRDPSSGQADVVGSGSLEYDLRERSGRITNPEFVLNTGESWYVRASVGKPVLGDSASGREMAFYGSGGALTSCSDPIPDYHFEFKEVKKSGANTLVARPAVLYIRDIPVMWLPFIFQDTRQGRHSGILTPRFGLSDIVRNSPTYRRNVEDFGYYFAVSDYMDARLALDWRSAAGATEGDPGWIRYKGEWSYNWLNRFLSGRVATDYTRQRDGRTNLAISANHRQKFTPNSSLSANINYVTSTALQRQNSINPAVALATISSTANYQQRFGPASLNLGATRTQYPGRDQVQQTLPQMTLTTGPINIAPWLLWTPNLSYTSSQTLHLDQPGLLSQQFQRAGDSVITTNVERNSYNTSLRFDTPLQILGYNIGNSFSISQQVNDYPQQFDIFDVQTGDVLDTRIFSRTYNTKVDWTPNFQLPAVARNVFNISPSVSLQNVDPGPFWIRSERTNGAWVHQSKRPTFSVAASPTIFGLIPGFGPFLRLRHSITPSIGYSYAPAARVDTTYLKALGRSGAGYLGALRQNAVSFGLTQNVEAKIRAQGDTTGDQTEKIKLLSMNFTSLTYDFERARATGRPLAGLTSDRFGYSLSSDLLPGFSMNVGYSLFQGSTLSDTARFKPRMDNVSATFSFSNTNNPLIVFHRLFGKAVPPSGNDDVLNGAGENPDRELEQRLAAQPVAGSGAHGAQFIAPPPQGWGASFTFSSSRPRPPVGGNIIDFDPRARCEPFRADPLVYDACIRNQQNAPSTENPVTSETVGGAVYRIPPTTSLNSRLNFRVTENWSALWSTSYDFERSEFASHVVSLVRDLHDWRAVFGFTQSPNGNFAFTFYIALKAEPDLKFDYNRATIRSQSGTVR